MTGKRKRKKKSDPNRLEIPYRPDEDEAKLLAETTLQPTVQAAATLQHYGKGTFADLDLMGLVKALSDQTQAAIEGEMSRGVAMLAAQAHTLDAIFNHLARRATNAEYMDQLDRNLKLALRAQSQSRATWEAIATIKNPSVMGYVRQANFASGPQLVNNASASFEEAPRAREYSNLQNKLLDEKDGERLDPGTACTPGRADPAMATVGEVDRAEDRGR